MPHAPERKEKDCLNCGTHVQGRYCQVCGQENVVPKESFGALVIHFFYDITHFDGKFFDTARYLFFRPGFLSKEYMRGRRARYLNPIRMYIFTSAFFFLMFFAFFKPDNAIDVSADDPYTIKQRAEVIAELKEDLAKNPQDSALVMKQLNLLNDTTRHVTEQDLLAINDRNRGFNFIYKIEYKTKEAYDSVQRALPRKQRDGWFKRRIINRGIALRQDITYKRNDVLKSWGDHLLHQLPYMLFVSLPFFALILKLLYIRRKTFFYADHIIFTLHHYIFSFWLMLIFFCIDELQIVSQWGFFTYVKVLLILAWPVYLFLAMRRFYQQGRFKTFLKFFFLNILGLVMLVLLFVLFFFIMIL